MHKNKWFLIFFSFFLLVSVTTLAATDTPFVPTTQTNSGAEDALPLIIALVVYIITSFCFMIIAQKTNTEGAWMAWFPVLNLFLMSRIACSQWWPLLSVVLAIIFLLEGMEFLFLLSLLFLSINIILWEWRIFERLGFPGWWVLSFLVPVFGQFIFLVLLIMVTVQSRHES